MGIQYLTYGQIDKKKWDECIETASNGLIYGYSFYLDSMSKHWDALVLNDYESVMPLTWNIKYGIHYLYQPPLTPCLGVFGNQLNTALLNDFLKSIPGKFKYWDFYFNPGNFFQLADFKLYERVNYVLPLKDNYETISNGFRDNIKRNIKKSEKLQLIIKKNIETTDIFDLAKEQALNFSTFTNSDFEHFNELYKLLYQKEQAATYGVYMPSGQLVASALFLFSHNRAYYILVGNHPDGKTLGASHALINAFIKDHAGQNLLLDFEGSDIPSLAFFYSSFGAREEKYSAIRLNRLPALLKWMKRN